VSITAADIAGAGTAPLQFQARTWRLVGPGVKLHNISFQAPAAEAAVVLLHRHGSFRLPMEKHVRILRDFRTAAC